MDELYTELRKLFSEERTGKIFAEVFDRYTIDSIHHLSQNGYFEQMEFLINTGKEAHVFRAVDSAGHYRAIKVYKVETTDFKKMREYIDGDPRFGRANHSARGVIEEWVKKEYRNLQVFQAAGIRVPLALAFRKNVLVMEFIGHDGEAAPRLKEAPLQDQEKLRDWTEQTLSNMVQKARVIHADFSEYNILNSDGELVVIDCAQGVSVLHPRAREFLERDCKNMARFLSRNGTPMTGVELMEKARTPEPVEGQKDRRDRQAKGSTGHRKKAPARPRKK
jgi:RIO kinase 1